MAKTKRATIDQSEMTPLNTNPFAATTSTPLTSPADEVTASGKKPKKNKVVAISVALREDEYAEFDQIADTLEPWPVKRMAVMNEALRYFLREHKAGRVKLRSTIRDARAAVEVVS